MTVFPVLTRTRIIKVGFLHWYDLRCNIFS